MKICIINNIYPPYDRGGAEQVVVRTAEGLRDAGHTVIVLTGSPKGDECEEREGIKIYRTRPRNIFFYTDAHYHNPLKRLLWHVIDIFNFSTTQWVRDILTKEKPDIVHTHNLMGLSFLIPHTIRRLGIRHIHTVHDVQLVEPSAMILKEKEKSWRYTGLPTKLYSFVMRSLMGSPQVVISPSNFLKDFYDARGFFKRSKFEIVRNPLTFEVAEPKDESKNTSSEFNFLYLGQIEYHKGILLLVNSFLELQKQNTFNARLHIVGDGSLFDEVQTLASTSTKITVHGRKDRKELPALFAKMNMAIVPSLCYENSPTVIFESFAFGIPVLASNSEGIEELITEGENGVMFTATDADSLKEKIKWCVGHADEILQMSKKTNLSVKGLSQKEYITRLVTLYSK